jgi:uncharacterized protein
MKKNIWSLALGALFGVGLVFSGMTDPAKVRGFLDFSGAWNPSLAFVMGSAVATCSVFYAVARRRKTPVAAADKRPIDSRLVSGAAIFGIGWGMVGVCPGPSIVVLGSGALWSIVFVVAMIVGTRLARLRVRESAHVEAS